MAIKATKREGGNYRARVTYYDDNGVQRSESFTRKTKKEAESAAYDFKINRLKMTKPENITLGDAADKFIDSNKVLLVKAIKVFQIEANYSKDDLAQCLGIHTNTLRNKLRDPDTFTYLELKTLFKMMKMSEAQKAELI